MDWEGATHWFERNAVVIAAIEFVVLVISVLASMIGYLLFRRRHKASEKKADARHREIMESLPMIGQPPAKELNPDAALDRLQHLEPQIAAHSHGEQFSYDDIWSLHYALGDLGIAWPGPGVPPAFRRAISTELLAASKERNMKRACAAWRNTAWISVSIPEPTATAKVSVVDADDGLKGG